MGSKGNAMIANNISESKLALVVSLKSSLCDILTPFLNIKGKKLTYFNE